MDSLFEIAPLSVELRNWANRTLETYWGAPRIFSRWRYHDTRELPGFVAMQFEDPIGLATYTLQDGHCELVTLNSFMPGIGVGEALLYAVREAARRSGCKRLWLTTSNDNLPALQFYQKRGMAIVAVHRFAVDEARRQNLTIPIFGHNGIPCRDELELEMLL